MPAKKKEEAFDALEVQVDGKVAMVDTSTGVATASLGEAQAALTQVVYEHVNELKPEYTEPKRRETLLNEAVALAGQVQYYNNGLHGVDGDMRYTLTIEPKQMESLRKLLTVLREEGARN